MPKWIAVLFSHCIKWTRVLVPLPLQRPRGMLCWWKQRLCLCAEGWALPRPIRMRSSSRACVGWHSSWRLDQSECVWERCGHTSEQSPARPYPPPPAAPVLLPRPLWLPGPWQSRGGAAGKEQGSAAAQGCRVSEAGPAQAGSGSVIALFFLTDCAGMLGLQGRACCG